jgi:hypothetical protein
MEIKFSSSKIPQWAITKTMLGSSYESVKNNEEYKISDRMSKVANKEIFEEVIQKSEEEVESDIAKISHLSPSLKGLKKEAKKEGMINDGNVKDFVIAKTKRTNTLGPIITAKNESHATNAQKFFGSGSESFFSKEKERMSVSELSRLSIAGKLEEKIASKKKIEESPEDFKAKKLGSRNENTGMLNSPFVTCRTFDKPEENLDVYKLYRSASIKNSDDTSSDLKEIEQYAKDRMLGKIENLKKNKNDWKKEALKTLETKIKQSSVKSKEMIAQYYENKEKIESMVFTADEIKKDILDRSADRKLRELEQDQKKDNITEARKRKESIKVAKKESKESFLLSNQVKKTSSVIDQLARNIATQELNNQGFEEII